MIRACKRKLHNSDGASIIIAMVFMLICVFVGGSVLTAATMNSYRIEHLKDQDDFLLQRSAALLVSKDLGGEPLSLTIHDSEKTQKGLIIKASGEVRYTGTVKTSRDISFTMDHWDGDAAPFKRTVYESAILNYLNDQGVKQNSGVNVKIYARNVTNAEGKMVPVLKFSQSENDFWLAYPTTQDDAPTGTFTVTGNARESNAAGAPEFEIPRFDATFTCNNGTDNQYDYTITFDDFTNAKQDIQMRISMLANGAESGRRIPEVAEVYPGTFDDTGRFTQSSIDAQGNRVGTEVIRSSTLTTISWMAPRIEKGNVE